MEIYHKKIHKNLKFLHKNTKLNTYQNIDILQLDNYNIKKRKQLQLE